MDRKRLTNVLPPPWATLTQLEANANLARPVLLLGYNGFDLATSVDLVNGSPEDAFVTTRGGDLFYLQGSLAGANVLLRAGTTLGRPCRGRCSPRGWRRCCRWRTSGAQGADRGDDATRRRRQPDRRGRGRLQRRLRRLLPRALPPHPVPDRRPPQQPSSDFAAAQRWYHTIFDPTAAADAPASAPSAIASWRYRSSAS